jgi:hypothetical protein
VKHVSTLLEHFGHGVVWVLWSCKQGIGQKQWQTCSMLFEAILQMEAHGR